MISPDARHCITPEDLTLVGRAFGRPLESIGNLDELLDDRDLGPFLMAASLPGPSSSLLFYVLVRHSLLDVGIEDATVADYFAALVRDFGVRSRSHQVDDVDDHTHHYLVDILVDLAASRGDRAFKVSVHLGNYAVWLSGVFPERITARQIRRGGPDLSYYESLSARGFGEASGHRLAERRGLDGVLRTAAERVHDIRVALNRVSAQLDLRSSRLAA